MIKPGNQASGLFSSVRVTTTTLDWSYALLRQSNHNERPGQTNGPSTASVPMAMSMMVESMVHMVQTARTDSSANTEIKG